MLIFYWGGEAKITGGDGNDQIDAKYALWSEIDGDSGNDLIDGSDQGSDIIRGGGGVDNIFGRGGNDDIDGGEGNDVLHGGEGNDVIRGGPGRDDLYGGGGDDDLNGNEGDDLIFGNAGADTIYDHQGKNHVLSGGDGDDFISAEFNSEPQLIEAGPGNDTILGGKGDDIVRGAEGDDEVFGNGGNDTLYGHQGNDILRGGDGNDQLIGNDGDDTLYGEGGKDTLCGDAFCTFRRLFHDAIGFDPSPSTGIDDVLFGRNDVLFGGDGDDTFADGERVTGGPGSDTFFGNSESFVDFTQDDKSNEIDKIYNTAGVIVHGTSGDDRILIKWSTDDEHDEEAVLHPPFPDHPDLLIVSINGVETAMEYTPKENGDKPTVIVYGEEGDDLIEMTDYGAGQHWDAEFHGGPGNDTLIASDRLFGRIRSSYLYGDEGDDLLIGGAGPAFLVGGDGDDKFIGGTSTNWVIGAAEQEVVRQDAGGSAGVNDPSTSPDLTYHAVTLAYASGHLVVRSGEIELFSFSLDTNESLRLLGAAADKLLTIDLGSDFTPPSSGLHIHAGAGDNTLAIMGEGKTIDLTAALIHLTDFGRLDLSSIDANTVMIDTAAVRRLSPAAKRLTVTSGQNDQLVVRDASAWRLSDPVIRDGNFMLTAHNINGGNEAVEFESRHPWQNFLQKGDVNNDGVVSAADALRIINELARNEFSFGEYLSPPLYLESWPNVFFDHNGDDRVTALDALQVINEIGRQPDGMTTANEPVLIPTVDEPMDSDDSHSHSHASLDSAMPTMKTSIGDVSQEEPGSKIETSRATGDAHHHDRAEGEESARAVDELLAEDSFFDGWS